MGTFRVLRVAESYILIREFYEGYEKYTSLKPQKFYDELTRPEVTEEGFTIKINYGTVPLFTGIEFVAEDKIRIFKLDVEEGKVTGVRRYEHSVLKKEADESGQL